MTVRVSESSRLAFMNRPGYSPRERGEYTATLMTLQEIAGTSTHAPGSPGQRSRAPRRRSAAHAPATCPRHGPRPMSSVRTDVSDDASGAARAAARHVAAAARAAIAERGSFLVAFSGGRTPGLMLAALAGEVLRWQQVHVFQVDERIAPAGDPARNLETLREALLAPGLLPARNLHPMPVEDAAAAGAARRYAGMLHEAAGTPPVLDLVHLGLGEDGHTASLVPGDAALHEADAPVTATGTYRGHRRITLTFPTLDRARERVWLATGADKAAMLARLHAADRTIPAGQVRQHASIVFCDAAAAAQLPR